MIELLFLGSAAFVGGAHAMRKSRAARHPRPRARQHSLLVKAWNSAGAPHTEESMLGDALADLGGRAIGSTVRRTAPRVKRRGQAVRNGAASRWQRRRNEDRTVTFFRRRNRSSPATGKDETGAADAGGKRPNDAPPLPGGSTPAALPRGGSPLPLPPGSDPSAPNTPIPMPPGSARSASSAARTPSRRAAGGRRQGRGGSPARQGGRRRAQARMRVAVPLNLEAPGTDVEFLDACADLQQMLRGIGVAVEDWNDELMIRRLPSIVTGPLERVHDGLVDGAACTALATVLFENWFAEAREIAAAGIEFTGDDPE
ncbi:hypothetical protein [Actinomadura rudentiformis]|uniref:Uncharacterized protein n=1 Tax=Actinomadura rudentiformis TaxID=359158 RepID=A0A6H9YYZ8_9ACTN|nr:hypothetical protein [Actinomadura rudentiformis]KAB2347253.1 hypothetical protein F8566_19715 [Actinomadura rudentiformis]